MAMTTSMTRSRRAGEGLHPSHPQAARHPQKQKQQQQQQLVGNAKNGVTTTTTAAAVAQGSPNNLVHANLHHRRKRSLDASPRDFDPIVAKKARFAGIAVEIPSRSSFHSRSAREATGTGTDAKATKAAAAAAPQQHHHHHHQQQQQQQQQQRQQLQPPPPPPTPKVYKQTPTSSTKSVAFATTAAAVARPNGHGHAASRTSATSTSTIVPPPRPAIAKAATTARGHKQPQQYQQKQQQPALTKHKEKVVNGLKHELNRLQPSSADIKSQGRKLRSQEATRFKSELSAYFPDYDEVIGNEPKEQHILGQETPLVIINVNSNQPPPSDAPDGISSLSSCDTSIRSYGDALFTDLWDSQRIDFSFLAAQHKNQSVKDPLPDSWFEPAHKKSERLERSIRNSEKGRAQHEKDQIIRLLNDLQGPDWLRVMGVSGITESRKKTFEPARDYFIKGCQAILEKFRSWAAEEKRRKLEKDRAIAEAEAEAKREAALRESSSSSADDEEEEEEEEVEDEEEDVEDDSDVDEELDQDGDTMMQEVPDSNADSEDDDDQIPRDKDADPPDDSDVDASIAKQLREEALAAAKTRSRRAGGRTVTPTLPTPPPPRHHRESEPYKEFTSFFEKKYQRDAAVNRSRRRGRTLLAWGKPMPEVDEADFELPEEILNEEALRTRARGKRRSRRGKS